MQIYTSEHNGAWFYLGGPGRHKILFNITRATSHADTSVDATMHSKKTHPSSVIHAEKARSSKGDDHRDGPAGRGDASNSSRMCGSRSGNEVNKRKKSDMRIKVKRKHTQHACSGRGRNSSGAAINPDTKKRTRQHGKQAELRFSTGTTSLVPRSSILLKCRPLACSQEEK